MRKQLAACGAGLALTFLVPGEVSQGPTVPERFAGYVSDKPDKCPNGTRQPMPSILLQGEMFAQRGKQADETVEADLKMQESICRTAIHIGTSLLSAVNNYSPKSGFRVDTLYQNGMRRPTGISAHPKAGEHWVDIAASYVTGQDEQLSGPATITRVDGIWQRDGHTYDHIQISKMRLHEGGQAWDLQASRHHTDTNIKETLVDSTNPVSTMKEFQARIDATMAALETLNRIPLPPIATE